MRESREAATLGLVMKGPGPLIFALAAVVGLGGGLLGVAFQQTLAWCIRLATGQDTSSFVEAATTMGTLHKILMPAAGGLLAGLFLLVIDNRRGPFGIADTMRLVVSRRGTIRLRDSLVQILSSICSISGGASIGKEGANSQLGATLAAALSELCRMSSRDRAVLLGCGISAGMAISYNAPIAGALFVMEVVLGNFAMDVFAPMVVSSVMAVLVTRPFQLTPGGDGKGLYAIPDVAALAWWLVLAAALLGFVCGAGAIFFRRSLELGGALFRKLRLPPIGTLTLGGLGVGALGVLYPQVWGNGYDVVHWILEMEADDVRNSMTLMFGIMALKVIATSLSIGSGALGGVFTPTLVVGATLGAGFGGLLGLLPFSGSDLHRIFALVGMAGLTAAIAHAPITAVILVFELTHDYDLILPTMLCSIIASVIARIIDPHSIYTARLSDEEHMLAGGLEALALQTTYVRDVMRTDPVTIRDTATFDEVMEVLAGTRRDTIYAVDERGRLVGHILLQDVKNFLNDPSLTSAVIAADLTRSPATVTPDQSLATITPHFDDPDLDELAVVTDRDAMQLAGRVTRRDVIAVLSEEVLGHRALRAKLKVEDSEEATYIQLPAGTDIARVDVPDDFAGRVLDSLDTPAEFGFMVLLVVEPQEDGSELRRMAEPGTVLKAGSSVIVFGKREAIERFAERARAGP